MRKLMWFSLGFLTACLICALLWVEAETIAACVGFGTTCAVRFALGRKYGWLRRLGAVCLGLAMGFGWYQVYSTVYLDPARALDGQTAELTIQCLDYSDETSYGVAVDGLITVKDTPYKVWVYLNGEIFLEPGDIITGEFEMYFASVSDIYRQGRGIFLTARQASDAQLGKPVEVPWEASLSVFSSWRWA